MFAFLLVRPLGSRFEKKALTLWTMAAIIGNSLWWYGGRLLGVLPENGSGILFALAFLHQFVVVVAVVIWQSVAPSMIADVADEHEVETGERKEGVFFAALAFAIKVPTGLGNALGGLLVGWVGLPVGAQPGTIDANALFRLGLAAGPIVAASFGVPLYLFTRFHLTRARHAELRHTLRRPRLGTRLGGGVRRGWPGRVDRMLLPALSVEAPSVPHAPSLCVPLC